MPCLLDHFSSVISEGLNLEAILSSNEGHLDAAAVRSKLVADVKAAQAAARCEVHSEQDLQLASHAVVAWIDEVMLGYPDWGSVVPNLQGELLGTQIARETFFNYLDELDDTQDDVREIYYVTLCLGFRGFYGELSNGREELERFKDLHGRRLKMVPASAATLVEERLSAQPYGVMAPAPLPPPKPRRKPQPMPPAPLPRPMPVPPPRTPPRAPLPRPELRQRKKKRLGLILGLILLPFALLLIAGFFLLPSWLRQQVDHQIAGLDCAHLAVSLGKDRIVRLEGYVASESDRQGLLTSLGSLFGLAGVNDNIAVYPWPFCEALDIVRPYYDQNITNDLKLGLDITAADNVLKNGDPLILTIRAPSYPAYLYVDYYQQSGDVGHVAHASANDAPDRANDEFDYPTGFAGSKPYGVELLTIFSSPRPLFSEPLPKFEDSATYFPMLRQRLLDLKNSPDGDLISASLVFIRTEP